MVYRRRTARPSPLEAFLLEKSHPRPAPRVVFSVESGLGAEKMLVCDWCLADLLHIAFRLQMLIVNELPRRADSDRELCDSKEGNNR